MDPTSTLYRVNWMTSHGMGVPVSFCSCEMQVRYCIGADGYRSEGDNRTSGVIRQVSGVICVEDV